MPRRKKQKSEEGSGVASEGLAGAVDAVVFTVGEMTVKASDVTTSNVVEEEQVEENADEPREDGGDDNDNDDDDADEDDVDDDFMVPNDVEDGFNFDADEEELGEATLAHVARRAAEDEEDDDDDGDDDLDDDNGDDDEQVVDAPVDAFGATLSTLLQQNVKDTKKPILPRAAAAPVHVDAKTLRLRQQRKRRLELKMLRERSHIRPQFTEVERKYVRIATKGVVALFNAVQKHQRELKEQSQGAVMKMAVTSGSTLSEVKHEAKAVDKQSFLNLLKAQSMHAHVGVVAASSSAAAATAAAGKKRKLAANTKSTAAKSTAATAAAAQQTSTWSVLRDDYMMKSKLTDWSKSMLVHDHEDGAANLSELEGGGSEYEME